MSAHVTGSGLPPSRGRRVPRDVDAAWASGIAAIRPGPMTPHHTGTDADWNPFMPRLSGPAVRPGWPARLAAGERLTLTVRPGGAR
jgi:hypothetical protein